jgi:hypothetical protein
MPIEPVISLVMTFNQGIEVERLSRITTGHAALMAWIDEWLRSLETRSSRGT